MSKAGFSKKWSVVHVCAALGTLGLVSPLCPAQSSFPSSTVQVVTLPPATTPRVVMVLGGVDQPRRVATGLRTSLVSQNNPEPQQDQDEVIEVLAPQPPQSRAKDQPRPPLQEVPNPRGNSEGQNSERRNSEGRNGEGRNGERANSERDNPDRPRPERATQDRPNQDRPNPNRNAGRSNPERGPGGFDGGFPGGRGPNNFGPPAPRQFSPDAPFSPPLMRQPGPRGSGGPDGNRADDPEEQWKAADRIFNSPLMKRYLELIEENAKLKARLEVNEILNQRSADRPDAEKEALRNEVRQLEMRLQHTHRAHEEARRDQAEASKERERKLEEKLNQMKESKAKEQSKKDRDQDRKDKD